MSKVVTVQVQKAGLTLMANESIQQFMSACSSSGREHLVSKMKLPADAYAWPRDIYADSAVFSVDFVEKETKKYVMKTVAMPYTRSKDGAFMFDGVQEVKPVTIYKPVNPGVGDSLKIAKALAGTAPEETEMVDMTVNKSVFGPRSVFTGLV